MKTKRLGKVIVLSGLITLMGCQHIEEFTKTGYGRFLSPDKPILKPDSSQVNIILPNVGELDTPDEMYPNARKPQPQDWTYIKEDYVIGPTDVLNITIMDLYFEGQEHVLQREVSDSGFIDLPQLPQRILAEGKTSLQLTDAIEKAYSPHIIRDPDISVTVVARRQQNFAILGAAMRPGTYSLIKKDMRLLDALALAGGFSQQDIEYIYVIRQAPPVAGRVEQVEAEPQSEPQPVVPAEPDEEPLPELSLPMTEPAEDENLTEEEMDSLLEPATPSEQEDGEEPGQAPLDPPEVQPELPTNPGNDLQTPIEELIGEPAPGSEPMEVRFRGADVLYAETAGGNGASGSNSPVRWVYRDGQWVRLDSAEESQPATQPETVPQPAPQPETPTQPEPVAQPEPTPEPVPAPRLEPETSPEPVAPLSQPDVPTPALPDIEAPQPEPRLPVEEQPTEELIQEQPAAPQNPEDPFGWMAGEKTDLVETIAINVRKLEQGDYRQNIVIREDDIIQIPPLTIGEFYVMGEVARPGVYSLTGRRLTLKQAVAAAGNLGPLSFPENSVLIRRIGRNQEQFIPINIEKIIRGVDPDIILKPDDVVAVGTHWSTSFLAVMRNAFRMTYGFGFIYDRNFSDPLFVTPTSKRFTRL